MAAPRPVTQADPVSPASSMPIHAQSVGLGPDVLKKLREAITEAGKASGQDIVALIGNTGVGKSTAVNDLTGHKVVYDKVSRVMKVAQGEGIAKIGDRAATSETSHTCVHARHPLPTRPPLVLADAGGFLDSRGTDLEILTATSLKLTLENARTVRLILCFDAKSILTDRGVQFAQFVQTALRQLMQDYRSCPQSTMLMLTKPPAFADDNDPEGGAYTRETALEALGKLHDDLGEGSDLRQIYAYILREGGKYVAIYSPVRQETKGQVLKTLGSMEGIGNPRGFFNLPYSPQLKLKLVEVMSGIAFAGAERYKSFFDHESQIKTRRDELRDLKNRKEEIDRAVNALGSGVSDPEIIKQSIAAIIGAQDAIIEDERKRITQCEKEEQDVKAKIADIDQKVVSLDQKGEEKQEYWKDSINQEGINIESVTTSTHSKSRSYPFYSKDDGNTTQTKTYDKRPTMRDFEYRGPTIADVRLDPPLEKSNFDGQSYWSKLTPEKFKGQDRFAVHYQTGKGEDARATVTVFVLNKDLPTSLLEKSEYSKQKLDQAQKLKELSETKRGYEKLIAEAEKTKAIKGGTKERVAQYQESLAQLVGEIERVEALIASLTQQNEMTKAAIVADRENSQFLREYLRLSGDHQLRDKENIREFLELDRRFRSINSDEIDEKTDEI